MHLIIRSARLGYQCARTLPCFYVYSKRIFFQLFSFQGQGKNLTLLKKKPGFGHCFAGLWPKKTVKDRLGCLWPARLNSTLEIPAGIRTGRRSRVGKLYDDVGSNCPILIVLLGTSRMDYNKYKPLSLHVCTYIIYAHIWYVYVHSSDFFCMYI